MYTKDLMLCIIWYRNMTMKEDENNHILSSLVFKSLLLWLSLVIGNVKMWIGSFLQLVQKSYRRGERAFLFTKYAVYYRKKQCSKSHWQWKWTVYDYLQGRRKTNKMVEKRDMWKRRKWGHSHICLFDGPCDGNKQGRIYTNEEYFDLPTGEQMLLFFQARKAPELEWTIL